MVLNILHMLCQKIQTVTDDTVCQQDVDCPYKQACQHADGKEPPGHGNRCLHAQQKHEKWEDNPNEDAKAHHPDSEIGKDPFSDSYHK